MATLKNTKIQDTGYIQVPTGSEAQRPNSPESGYIRFNTDNTEFETYDGTQWKKIGLTEYVKTYSVTDSTTSTNEGTTITFTTTTTNVSNGTTLYYTLTGVDSNDVSTGTSGNFTINNNSGTVDVTLTNDLTTEGNETLTFQVRTDSVSGGIVATDTTTINDTSLTPSFDVEYLVVAGGAGGGGRSGGGGGAGGLKSGSLNIQPQSTHSVTIGAGGSGGAGTGGAGGDGSNSVFSTITSNGGGGGAPDGTTTGRNGGSGGGGKYGSSGGNGISGQGNNGGSGTSGTWKAGGGGGASSVGVDGASSPSLKAGNGGAGSYSDISGTSVAYAGGGGGGSHNSDAGGCCDNSSAQGIGGIGGGGNGGVPGGKNSGFNGTNNLGGGGGGGSTNSSNGGAGGSGGSGIVILKYPSSHSISESGLTTSTTTIGSFKITQITSGTGTVTFN